MSSFLGSPSADCADFLDIARPPGAVERRSFRAVQAQVGEPAFARIGLDRLRDAFWGLTSASRLRCEILRAARTSDSDYWHRYLQTKSLTMLSGLSGLPTLARCSTVFFCAATLGSFALVWAATLSSFPFGAFSAITIAQKIL